eukprot:TRINITY_DN1027_c0_g1_i2.p1 TRINITY_DN1027_c0_g1~~TRINITY_DN1027_c0_g1_i2.p1  ORF type:complete len:330 (+),score=30.82 TRINITY_DN1027_c0_g1_i2:287-1276(+)
MSMAAVCLPPSEFPQSALEKCADSGAGDSQFSGCRAMAMSRDPSYSRDSVSSDDYVSSECTSEQEESLIAAALAPLSPLTACPPISASSSAASLSSRSASVSAPLVASRGEIQQAEIAERMTLTGRLETLQRIEVSRMERTARDELKRSRALYMRAVLSTAPHRGYGPAVWPRHTHLPAASFYPCSDYTGSAPARSCIRRHKDGTMCSRPSRRITMTDCVVVQAGAELPETDGELASAQWRSISMYAPVRHMVMTSLKMRFGADASDPQGWMETVERYAWLDDIFCDVKDTYQQLHNEEAAEWVDIMEQERMLRKRDWWSNMSKMIWWP